MGMVTPILDFADLLRKGGIDPQRVWLIRHAGDEAFERCFECGQIVEYTQIQGDGFGGDSEYWAVFVGDEGTTAKFYGMYKNQGHTKATAEVIPPGFIFPEWFDGNRSFYALEPVDAFAPYKDRLVIDWTGGPRNWAQSAANDRPKPIIALATLPRSIFDS